MKKVLLFFGLMAFGIMTSNVAYAQDKARRNCAAHDKHELLMKNNAKYRMNRENIESHYRKFLESGATSATSGGVRTIPVYVHVLYRTSQENISDAQINSQISVLNEDFSATNSDIGGVPSEFAGVVADYEIQFTLAGVTRTSTNKTSWGTNDDMKKSSKGGVDPVTPDTHMNMWICNIGGGILGYAQFPGGSAATDGVVFSPQYCGSSDYDTNGDFYLDAPFDKGRTATHEVGHYLNLRHIWGDGGCSVDDFVSDTPTSGGANYGCPSYPTVSCSSNDMTMNYMDYVDDACMYMFTAGQKSRTASIFAAGGSRENLGTVSGGCSLAAPSGLASSNIADNSFSLSWNSVSGAVSYDVSINGTVTTTGGTSYNATGLTAGTTYSTMVRANCESGSGSYSSALNVTTTGSNCATGPASLTLVTDNYASETSWTLKKDGSTVATNGSLSNNNTYNISFDYGAGAYEFTINDSYGDGICCGYGNGSYTITDGNSNTIASGGAFGSSATDNFCIEGGGGGDTEAPSTPGNVSASNVTTSSADLSWNASSDNVGVDQYNVSVDGSLVGTTSSTSYSLSGLSASTTYSISVTAEDAAGNVSGAGTTSFTTDASNPGGSATLVESYFESGWDGWSDGGSDCARYSGSRSYEGNYSIRLRDNSGTKSAMTSGSHDVSGYDQISVEFYFYSYSMENGEDFWVRYYDGSGWSTVAAYARGTHFDNNGFYTATVNIDKANYNFPSNAEFRFQCDASGNKDQIYIDQVTITATSGGARTGGNAISKLHDLNTDGFEDLALYPNPASTETLIRLDFDESAEVEIKIINIQGREIKSMKVHTQGGVLEHRINVSDLENGLYFVNVSTSNGENEVIKMMVSK